jgi:hypothetical protein
MDLRNEEVTGLEANLKVLKEQRGRHKDEIRKLKADQKTAGDLHEKALQD